MRRCPKCNKEIYNDAAKYCRYCGSPLPKYEDAVENKVDDSNATIDRGEKVEEFQEEIKDEKVKSNDRIHNDGTIKRGNRSSKKKYVWIAIGILFLIIGAVVYIVCRERYDDSGFKEETQIAVIWGKTDVYEHTSFKSKIDTTLNIGSVGKYSVRDKDSWIALRRDSGAIIGYVYDNANKFRTVTHLPANNWQNPGEMWCEGYINSKQGDYMYVRESPDTDSEIIDSVYNRDEWEYYCKPEDEWLLLIDYRVPYGYVHCSGMKFIKQN